MLCRSLENSVSGQANKNVTTCMEKTRMSVFIGHAGLDFHEGNKKVLECQALFYHRFFREPQTYSTHRVPNMIGHTDLFFAFCGKDHN